MVSQFEVYETLKNLKRARITTIVKTLNEAGHNTHRNFVSEKLRKLYRYGLIKRRLETVNRKKKKTKRKQYIYFIDTKSLKTGTTDKETREYEKLL